MLYSNKELLSQPYQNFIHPDDHEINENEVFNLRQGRETIGFINRYICKDGSILPIEWVATPYPEENLMYAIGRDVTERKKAGDALKLNEKRYIDAQKIGHVGSWEYDLMTEDFWASDETKSIYGFDLESKDFTTDEVENCIPDRERVHQALVDLIEKGQMEANNLLSSDSH